MIEIKQAKKKEQLDIYGNKDRFLRANIDSIDAQIIGVKKEQARLQVVLNNLVMSKKMFLSLLKGVMKDDLF